MRRSPFPWILLALLAGASYVSLSQHERQLVRVPARLTVGETYSGFPTDARR